MSTYTRAAYNEDFVPTLLEVIDENLESDFSSSSSSASSINSFSLPPIFENPAIYDFIDPMEICATLEGETPTYRSLDDISDDVMLSYLENERKDAESEPSSPPSRADILKEQHKREAFESLYFSFPTFEVSERLEYISKRLSGDEEIVHFEVDATVSHPQYSQITFADNAEIKVYDSVKWGQVEGIKKVAVKPRKSCLRYTKNPYYKKELEAAIDEEESVTVEQLEQTCIERDESYDDDDTIREIQVLKEYSLSQYRYHLRQDSWAFTLQKLDIENRGSNWADYD